MFPVEAFQRTVEKFVSILTQLEIPFHITGGSISSAYGEPRLTQAIDLDVYPRELIPGELSRSETAELFNGVYLPQQRTIREAAIFFGLQSLIDLLLSEPDEIR